MTEDTPQNRCFLKTQHCRFCADEKKEFALLDLQSDTKLYHEVCEKLSFFNGIDTNLLFNNDLPKTVCKSCYSSLDIAYSFLCRVRNSQQLITSSYKIKQETSKFDVKLEPIIPNDVKIAEPNEVMEIPTIEKVNKNYDDSIIEDTEICFEDQSKMSENTDSSYENNEEAQPKISDNESDSSKEDEIKNLPINKSWLDYQWPCQHCKKESPDVHLFRKHCQSEHHVCCAFKCADCNESYDTYDGFVEHVRKHRIYLRFYCEYCNENLTTDNAKSHREAHFSKEQICPHCGDIFETLASLKEHAAYYEPKKERVRIRKPNTKPVQGWKISQLKDKSWSGYQWRCGSCSKTLNHVDKLREHTRNVHNKCFDMKCIDCTSVENNCYRNFVNHVRLHRAYLKDYCHYCNHKYSNPEEESVHIAAHFSGTRIDCYSCGIFYPDRPTLQQHLATYNPPIPKYLGSRPERPLTADDLTCVICNKLTVNLESLKRHMKRHARRTKDHICDICGKTYYEQGELTAHKLIHTDGNETCKICNKSFKTLLRLRKHVSTHSTDRPFSCDLCHKAYKKNDDLKRHDCTQSEVTPLKCEFCGKGFRRKNNLDCHLRQHTGDRPFSCSDCDKTFTNWANCNKHMTRIHGKTLAKTKRTPIGQIPLDPETGLVTVAVESESTREWKEQLLAGRKRSRKNAEESV